VRVVDRRDSLSVDIRDDGTVPVRIEGTAKSGSDSEDEVRICQTVIDRFNSEGGQWGNATDAKSIKGPRETGIDVIAKHLHDKNRRLNFQVTRIDPDPDQKLWNDLGKTGVAEKTYPSVDDVAEAIYKAIKKKLDKHEPQEDIVLVLNATQLPIGLPPVRDAFEQRYGAWLRQVKFEEVWIVEPFHDDPWTCRLSK